MLLVFWSIWLGSIDLHGIENEVDESTLAALLEIDAEDWRAELEDQEQFFAKFGERLPVEIRRQHEALRQRMGL